MRIRLVNSLNHLEDLLTRGEDDVLPLLVTNATAPAFDRLRDRLAFPRGPQAPGTHAIAGVPASMTGRIAEAWASVSKRPFVPLTGRQFAAQSLTSITAVLPEGLARPLPWLQEFVQRHISVTGSLDWGVLVGQGIAELSLLLAKQLAGATPGGTHLYLENQAPELALRTLPGFAARGTGAVEDLAADLRSVTGTLLLGGHSRAHCGPVRAIDGLFGICSSPTRGEGGLCVGGRPCFFAESTKVSMLDCSAQRVFYNGCATASLGANAFGMPKEANHAFAVLAGNAVEFIGNLRPSRSTATDLRWFIALSAAGVGPAAAVRMIEQVRSDEGRELHPSLLYIGDASNRAWDVGSAGVLPIGVYESNCDLVLEWPETSGLLIGNTPVPSWMNEPGPQGLSAVTDQEFRGNVRLVFDSRSTRLYVLVDRVGRKALSIRLEPHERPSVNMTGARTANALRSLNRLARITALASVVTPALPRVERSLGDVMAMVSAEAGIADVARRCALAEKEDLRLSVALDRRIAKAARRASAEGWFMCDEYERQMHVEPAHGPPCPLCDGPTVDYRLRSILETGSDHSRTQRVCGICGIVSDVPVWPIDIRLVGPRLWSTSAVGVGLEVVNRLSEPRHVAASLAVQNLKTRPDTEEVASIWVEPKDRAEMRLSAAVEDRPAEFHWLRVHVASHGALGLMCQALVLEPFEVVSIETRNATGSM